MMAERFRLSLEARFPSFAPNDALAKLGRDRLIMRGRNEPRAGYAARLIRYLDDLRIAGSPFALIEQVFHYLQTPGATIRTVDDFGNWFERAANGDTSALTNGDWNWDGATMRRFWLIIINGPWTYHWDPSQGAASSTTIATADEIASIMSLVKTWSPAGTQCNWIIIAQGSPEVIFVPGSPFNPDGTWGDWAQGSPMRPSRSSTARYWRGPR